MFMFLYFYPVYLIVRVALGQRFSTALVSRPLKMGKK